MTCFILLLQTIYLSAVILVGIHIIYDFIKEVENE